MKKEELIEKFSHLTKDDLWVLIDELNRKEKEADKIKDEIIITSYKELEGKCFKEVTKNTVYFHRIDKFDYADINKIYVEGRTIFLTVLGADNINLRTIKREDLENLIEISPKEFIKIDFLQTSLFNYRLDLYSENKNTNNTVKTPDFVGQKNKIK
ncbi:MAG: hypothetical protein ACRCX2_09625, partial [Paraclostridium sp.]